MTLLFYLNFIILIRNPFSLFKFIRSFKHLQYVCERDCSVLSFYCQLRTITLSKIAFYKSLIITFPVSI